MRHLLISIICLIVVACGSHSELTIHNRTNYNIEYVINDGSKKIITGRSKATYQISEKGMPFINSVPSKLKIFLEGEVLEPTTRELTVYNDKSYTLNVWATHAGLKVVNATSHPITKININKTYLNDIVEVDERNITIPINGIFWIRLQPNKGFERISDHSPQIVDWCDYFCSLSIPHYFHLQSVVRTPTNQTYFYNFRVYNGQWHESSNDIILEVGMQYSLTVN